MDYFYWRISSTGNPSSLLMGTIHVYPRGSLPEFDEIIEKILHYDQLVLERNIFLDDEGYMLDKLKNTTIVKQYEAIISNYNGILDSMETRLYNRYLSYGKPIKGLETIHEALEIIEQLDEMPIGSTSEILEDFNEMVKAYKNRNLNDFFSKFKKQIGEKNLKLLINERNAIWCEKIPQILKQKSLILVGAAHLFGTEGLIELLRRKKFVLEKFKL